MEIILKETRTENGIKTVENRSIDLLQYKNITDEKTLQWFRRLGGRETASRNYTSRGYNITKLISTSPDRSIKVIREFEFI